MSVEFECRIMSGIIVTALKLSTSFSSPFLLRKELCVSPEPRTYNIIAPSAHLENTREPAKYLFFPLPLIAQCKNRLSYFPVIYNQIKRRSVSYRSTKNSRNSYRLKCQLYYSFVLFLAEEEALHLQREQNRRDRARDRVRGSIG